VCVRQCVSMRYKSLGTNLLEVQISWKSTICRSRSRSRCRSWPPPPSLPPTLPPPSFSFTHTSLLLSHWNGLVKAVAEQPSSADVGTTCGWLCCMLPGSNPPPCTPLPFCGISCTSPTSIPSSVEAFVLPVLIAVDHSKGAHIQRILCPI